MKIYLDCCSLQRPFDDRTQLRIRMEAEAVLAILSLFEAGDLELVHSEAIEYEIGNMSEGDRRFFCTEILRKMGRKILVDVDIERRAKTFAEVGIRPLDALHLAMASYSKADYFCTCDDRFYIKAKVQALGGLKVVKPLELIEDIEHDD